MMLRNCEATTSFLLLLFCSLKRCFAFVGSCPNSIRCHHSLPGDVNIHVVGGSTALSSSSTNKNNSEGNNYTDAPLLSAAGDLEKLKQEEAKLASMLASVRRQKLSVLRARPLRIGIIGFGRFGQFIAKSFAKYGHVIGTSRSDYTAEAAEIGVKYMPLSNLESFVVDEELDVIVLATSIVSFEDTVKDLVPHLQTRMEKSNSCPLVVDVASVKEHPRDILLQHLPVECDVLCTHPMFGPDSARDGWHGQTFVYEQTRINKVIFEPEREEKINNEQNEEEQGNVETFFDGKGVFCGIYDDDCDEYIESKDRIERFLSIWEEEGCKMTQLSCRDHDAYAANSQFITHLMGRILGAQGLHSTPIDTKGFQSVLKLIENTNADSFDLFYGLYKYNRNSGYTIGRLRGALDDVVGDLLERDGVVGLFNNGNRRNLN